MKVYPKNLQSVFEAHQFTESWKENIVLKELCKKYKGDEHLVNETKQRVTFGDYVLVSGSTALVVSEQFFKENFSDVELTVAVTVTEEHGVVAVSLQDDEHRIHEALWERGFEEHLEAEAEQEERSEEDTTLQIKQYLLRNQVIELLDDSDLLLEKRIEKVKKLIAESDPEAAKLAIEHVKAELDIDIAVERKAPHPQRQKREKEVPRNAARNNSHRHQPKKGAERDRREDRIQFTVNAKIAYPH